MKKTQYFAAFISFLLLPLLGCPKQPIPSSYIVVTRGGGTPAAAPAGQQVVWSKFYPTDPDFTVVFPDKGSPCSDGSLQIPVKGTQPNGCIVRTISTSGDNVVYFFYTITYSQSTGGGSANPQEQKVIPFQVKGCGGCAVIEGDSGDGSLAMLATRTGSNNNPAQLSCNSGAAYAASSTVSPSGFVWWQDRLNANWQVDFGNNSPCSNGNTFASSGNNQQSTCNIRGDAHDSYTYTATFVNYAGCATASGPITVTIVK
jgi:hypothetical protein